jgi:hypothetical protein
MAGGHGGARVGSGRKPKHPQVFTPVLHQGGQAGEIGASAIPPEDLPSDQRAFWASYAPLAIEKGTLTPHTVAGFRLLCELEAEMRACRLEFQEVGRTFEKVTVDGSGQEHREFKKHPAFASYQQLAKDVRVGMLSFGLTAFGKPEAPIKRRPAANPWAAVGGR